MDEAKKYLEGEITAIDKKIEETKSLLQDPAMVNVANEELIKLEGQRKSLAEAIEKIDNPDVAESESTHEEFSVAIVEVRGGVGGDEAKIWAEDLLRMYTRFANISGLKVTDLDEGVIRLSGKLEGKGIFELLKYETGVHRVQRVPETEASGRIHTSTASIVVLPEVSETEVNINPDELEWEFTRSGGHGGQNVNKVATAVRLKHKPTGIIVQCRTERFQEQNRKIALNLLRAQLWEIEEEKKLAMVSGHRAQVGRAMRAEKIRTYNFPQNRVTDHRIGKSWHKLDKILEGELEDVVREVGESENRRAG